MAYTGPEFGTFLQLLWCRYYLITGGVVSTVCYQIDATDTLVFTDGVWFEFAAHNEFAQPNVVGTSLWRHITDPTTARIYQNLLKRVRQTGQSVEVSFRCKTESRALMNVLRASLPRSSDVLNICSWCNRIQVQRQWIEVESAVDKLGLLLAEQMPQLTHCICGDCAELHRDAS